MWLVCPACSYTECFDEVVLIQLIRIACLIQVAVCSVMLRAHARTPVVMSMSHMQEGRKPLVPLDRFSLIRYVLKVPTPVFIATAHHFLPPPSSRDAYSSRPNRDTMLDRDFCRNVRLVALYFNTLVMLRSLWSLRGQICQKVLEIVIFNCSDKSL